MAPEFGVSIKWRCKQCGSSHKRIIIIALPDDLRTPGFKRSIMCRLACPKCGWENPLQVSLGELTGDSPNQRVEGKLVIKRCANRSEHFSRWIRAVKHPSIN